MNLNDKLKDYFVLEVFCHVRDYVQIINFRLLFIRYSNWTSLASYKSDVWKDTWNL